MSKGPTPLTQEQRDAWNQVFYGVFRGAIGQNNFYREFSKRNKRQADSLEAWKNQKKTKKTPEQYAESSSVNADVSIMAAAAGWLAAAAARAACMTLF